MFQYAFGRASATRLGVELVVELSNRTLQIHQGYELERVFNIQVRVATKRDMQVVLGLQRFGVIRKALKSFGLGNVFQSNYVEEPYFNFSPQMLSLPDNTYVSGYWQSEKYFHEMAATIRSDFSFHQRLSDQNAALAEKIGRLASVSLHVRRNDYANVAQINSTHGLCSLAYYQSAIQYIADRVDSPHLFIFSDDVDWVKNNLKVDFPHEYVDHNYGAESYNDMRLMSLCRHHIIANSSFSWWGAWLNPSKDKIVVAPKHWFANKSNTQDLLPQDWVRL